MQKAVISPPTKPTVDKGKGRARDPEPVHPIAEPLEKPPTAAVPASSSSDAFVSVVGDLHLYDRATGLFMIQEAGVTASIHKTAEGFWLLVEGAKGPWVSQGIDSETSFSEVSLDARGHNFDCN